MEPHTYNNITTYNVQLLGKPPYEGYKKFSLGTIARKLMRAMKADFHPSTVEVYQKNLALLVRMNPACMIRNYNG